MTADEWAEVAAAVHALYSKTMKDAYVTIGAGLIGHHTRAVAYEAVAAHQRGERAQFFPTPGELAQIADRITGQAPPDFDEVWQEIAETIRLAGRRRDLTPPALRLVDAIGWSEIRSSERTDMLRGQARRMYEDQVRRRPVEQARLALGGPTRRLRSIDGGR